MNASPLRKSRRRLGAMGGMRAATAVAGVWGGATLFGLGAGVAHATPEVDAGILFAVPIAPTSFVDGWNAGVGFGGGVRWPLASRLRLGIEGEFLQFSPVSLGEDGLGGTRRSGGVAVPVSLRLGPADARVGGELVASAGYGHESIETKSGSMRVRGGRRDGVLWSTGGAMTVAISDWAKILADVRVGGIAGGGESSTQVVVRLGIRARPRAPQSGR